MTNKQVKTVLNQVAKRNGVSENEVRREIAVAIEIIKNNPDPNVQSYLQNMEFEGETPTVEEFIINMVDKINAQKKRESR